MYLALACLFSLTALVLAFVLHDRFEPARWFLLMWGGQVLLVYGLFHDVFRLTGQGLAFMAVGALAFSAGSVLTTRFAERLKPADVHRVFNEKRALWLLMGCMAVGLVNVALGIQANGFKLSEIFSFETLLKLNVAAADARYLTNAGGGLASQLSLVFVYLAPLFGGWLLPLLSKRNRVWSFLSVLPSMLIALTQAMKLNFVTGIALFVCGVMVASLAYNQSFIKLKASTWLKLAGAAALVFGVLLVSMFFKAGSFDRETTEFMSLRFVEYALGQVPAFDDWFAGHWGRVEPSWGIKTFYGISNALGLVERQQGVFNEFVYFCKNDGAGIPLDLSTNVFSLFRFLVEDFGTIGSLVFLLLTGGLSSLAVALVNKRRGFFVAQTVLAGLFFFVFLSFATSVWAYTSYLVALAGFYVLSVSSFTKRPILEDHR